MRIEISSTNMNATEHISENYKTNIHLSLKEMCFYMGEILCKEQQGGGGAEIVNMIQKN